MENLQLVAAVVCLVPCRQMYTLDRYIICFRQCQITERKFIIDFQRFQFSEEAYSLTTCDCAGDFMEGKWKISVYIFAGKSEKHFEKSHF